MHEIFDDLITALSWSGITARKATEGEALFWRFDQDDIADWIFYWDGEWVLSIDDPIMGDGDRIATIQDMKSPSALAKWIVATIAAIKEEIHDFQRVAHPG